MADSKHSQSEIRLKIAPFNTGGGQREMIPDTRAYKTPPWNPNCMCVVAAPLQLHPQPPLHTEYAYISENYRIAQ